MLSIVLEGADKFKKEMDSVSKQVPFATALALTRTASLAQAAIKKEMASVYDRPTNWTLNSLRIDPARKDKLRALVAVKDFAARGTPALRWISPSVEGGKRLDKKSEQRLQRIGALRSGYQTAVGRSTRTNKHGNLTRKRVLDAVKGAESSMQGGSPGDKYFLMRRGSTPIAIAHRRSRKNLDIVMAFVPTPTYSTLLDFYGIGQKVASKNLPIELKKALEHAIRTARRKS